MTNEGQRGAPGAETPMIGAPGAPGRERRMTARRKQEAFSGTSISGNHTVNDILTITDFQGSISEGNTVNETLGVYRWAGPGNNGTLPSNVKLLAVVLVVESREVVHLGRD